MSFPDNILYDYLRKIYNGFDTSNEIEPRMWREMLRILNEAAVKGLAQSDTLSGHEDGFLRAIRHSNEVFSAFKVHAMGMSMADKLLDGNGRLKSFDRWLNDVQGITSHHIGSWLRTEYDTAVLRAHFAADWQEFVANKDILPNLRWMPTTSPDAEVSHRSYWEKKLTLPVDHPFWAKHHPRDRWNCKCSLEATDDPATPDSVIDGIPDPKPHRGLENNPGKDGRLINDTHPYFPASCNQCAFYKPNLKNKVRHFFNVRKKDCFNCPYIDGCLERGKGITMMRNEVNTKRKEILESEELTTTSSHIFLGNMATSHYLPSKKALNALLRHCISIDELEAAVYMWKHPRSLMFERTSPLGEVKDLSKDKDKKNIKRKKERGVIAYNQYKMIYDDREWIVKLEVNKKNFESPYFLKKK